MLAGTIRKGGEEIKAMVALLVFFFIMATLEIVGRKGPFDGNVIKNPAS